MAKKKRVNLLVTGKTEQEWTDEMRVLELTEQMGIKSPGIKTCYLCKREEGEKSVCLL